MISTEGREDVGGVWAVSRHPQHAGRGIASSLLDEAHARMRAAGLRFSTLGTERSGVGYKLYQKHGYVDMQVWATALAHWETAHQPTRLCAQPPGSEGYDFVERIFENITGDYLGFAWRHTPFARLRDRVTLDQIWILWENRELLEILVTDWESPPVPAGAGKVRALIFDAGDVLYHRPERGVKFSAFLKTLGKEINPNHAREKQAIVHKAYRGQISHDEYRESIVRIYGITEPQQIERGKQATH